MILLENAPLLIDGQDTSAEGYRREITDERLSQALESDEQLAIVARPASIEGPSGLKEDITVENRMTLGKLGIGGSLRVLRGGRAEITIDTVPPVEVEGQLVRLGNNNAPIHQELAPDQLTFVPDKNGKCRELNFRDTLVGVR